jgi:hypothetical protein
MTFLYFGSVAASSLSLGELEGFFEFELLAVEDRRDRFDEFVDLRV